MGKSKGPRVKGKSENPPRQEKHDPIKPENRFFRYWKLFWAIVGPLIAAISTAANFQPEISITTGVNIDPTQTFAMQFAVSNTGRVPIRNLTFSCGLRPASGTVYIGSVRPGYMPPVPYLPKGQTVTRGCFEESKDILGVGLVVNVNYDWPWLPISGKKTVSFVALKTTTGFVMVPDYQNK